MAVRIPVPMVCKLHGHPYHGICHNVPAYFCMPPRALGHQHAGPNRPHVGHGGMSITYRMKNPLARTQNRQGVAPCRKPRDCGEHSIPVHPIECTLRITPARAGKASRAGRPSPRAGTTADRNGGLRSVTVNGELIETVFPGIRRDLCPPAILVINGSHHIAPVSVTTESTPETDPSRGSHVH